MKLGRSELLRMNAVSAQTGLKYCTNCEQFRNLDQFHTTETRNRCKPCFNKISIQRRRERVSGWTTEAYDEAFQRQNGVCAIPSCSNVIGAADHNHETGLARELLCKRCNGILGYVNENPDLLLDLSAYLRTHSCVKEEV